MLASVYCRRNMPVKLEAAQRCKYKHVVEGGRSTINTNTHKLAGVLGGVAGELYAC